PAGFQFPFFFSKATLSPRLGIAGEFTTSESYNRITTDTLNGASTKFSQPFDSKVTRLTGITIESGIDVEFRNVIGNTLLFAGMNYASPNIMKPNEEKYLLKYGSAISFRLGIGYFFAKKKKER